MGKTDFIDFLTPTGTFLNGMASVLDLAGALAQFNESETPQEADTKAIANDWEKTGRNLENAILSYGEKYIREKE